MKAYQLKIAVKNTKPPVWRRCVVPSGITYAQLSILLNEIAGWKDRPEYEYEFYQRALKLREDNGTRPFRPNWRYDLLKANETYINECLDQEEWFSYHLGNGYSHRVTIEKICDVEDERPCPCVEKYKGECPGEEPGSYDPDRVNTILKERYYVLYGEQADFSKQEELYDRMDRGEYGLSGQVNPINEEGMLHKSADRLLREFSDQLNAALKERARIYGELNPEEELEEDADIGEELIRFLVGGMREQEDKLQSKVYSELLHKKEPEWTDKVSNTFLKDAIDFYSKETLMDYADELNLQVAPSLDEAELREKIARELLRPSVMRRKMSILTDKQMELFERIRNDKRMYRFTEEEEASIVKLHNLDYIIRYGDGLVEVAFDVKMAYELINTPEFQEERGRIAWLNSCLLIASLLYARFPISVLRRLYRRKPGYKAGREELTEIFHKIPQEVQLFDLEDDLFILKKMKEKDEARILSLQAPGEDYYIPSLEEIESYAEHEYFFDDPAYQELRKSLKQQEKINFDDIEEILHTVNLGLSRGWSAAEISAVIDIEYFTFPDVESKKEFSSLVEKAAEHSRMLKYRGYTYEEMMRRNMAALDNLWGTAQDRIPAPMRQTASNAKNRADTKKIYPNDPCPCGSGKKYKKCCGRKV